MRLKNLKLKFVSGGSLSAIATKWPDLQSLSLSGCSIVNDEQDILPGSLQSLVSLGLRLHDYDNTAHVRKHVASLLLQATTQLASLRLDGAVLCAFFLVRCRTEKFPSLERLTLGTDGQLPGLELTADDLRCLEGALPSLRYAATDSYDLRLFFQHFMPAVTLDWCHCTTCAAEFPRLNDEQKDVWNELHGTVSRKNCP